MYIKAFKQENEKPQIVDDNKNRISIPIGYNKLYPRQAIKSINIQNSFKFRMKNTNKSQNIEKDGCQIHQISISDRFSVYKGERRDETSQCSTNPKINITSKQLGKSLNRVSPIFDKSFELNKKLGRIYT